MFSRSCEEFCSILLNFAQKELYVMMIVLQAKIKTRLNQMEGSANKEWRLIDR
jgi:hypothetical protein